MLMPAKCIFISANKLLSAFHNQLFTNTALFFPLKITRFFVVNFQKRNFPPSPRVDSNNIKAFEKLTIV